MFYKDYMVKALITAPGLDKFLLEFTIKETKPEHIAFLTTEATVPLAMIGAITATNPASSTLLTMPAFCSGVYPVVPITKGKLCLIYQSTFSSIASGCVKSTAILG